MTVPRAITIATVEEELPGVKAYAERHGWTVTWDPEGLRLIFEGLHPNNQRALRIIAAVDGYRALPPSWAFEDATTGTPCLPKRGTVAGKQSIFYKGCGICAPFNRRAYKEHGGPHGNWSGPESWLNVHGYARAIRLADMFALIVGHLKASPGTEP